MALYNFSKEELDEIYYKLLEVGSFEKIEKIFKINSQTLKRHLIKNGYQVLKNETFFSSIDSDLKAYYLGLLYTDGNISKPKVGQGIIQIGLIKEDSYVLETLCREVTPYKKVRYYKSPSPLTEGKFIGQWSTASDQMYQDLINLELTERKSYNLTKQLPNLSDELFPAFLRGMLDGDGTVANSKKEFRVAVSFLSCSELVCLQIKEFLKPKSVRVKCRVIKTVNTKMGSSVRKVPMYTAVIEDMKSLINLYDLLYTNASVYLERKKEAFHIESLKERSKPHKGEQCPHCLSYSTWKRNYYKNKVYFSCQDCGKYFVKEILAIPC